MQVEQILSVLEADMRASGITGLDLSVGEFALSLRLPPPAPASVKAPAPPKALKAPYAGYFTPEAGAGKVQAGQVVGTVTAGLVRLPVLAPAAGTLSVPAVEAGLRVDFGDVLFTLA